MTGFSIVLALGATLGLFWVVFDALANDRGPYLAIGISALMGALIGGRLAYIAVHWAYFQTHFVEIPQIWLGGLAWPGALAGGLLIAGIAAWLSGIPVPILADELLPLLVTLSVAVWLGCWMVGCVYGPEMNWGIPSPDEWGVWLPRLPLQIISALLTIILFWGVDRLRHASWGLIPGLAASLGLGGLALILLGTSLLRADPYPLWNGLRLETWAALLFLGVAVILSGVLFLRYRR